MTERFLAEKLKNLTPQQLNITLGKIFGLTPTSTNLRDHFERDFSSSFDQKTVGVATDLDTIVANVAKGIDATVTNLIGEWNKTVQQRSESEFLDASKRLLESLLERSYLTTSAIDNLIATYSRTFILGFASRKYIIGELYWLCDPGDPLSGGIFDPETAKNLEYRLFLKEVDRYEHFKFVQESRGLCPNAFNGEIVFDADTLSRGRQNTDALELIINRWKKDYKTKHGNNSK